MHSHRYQLQHHHHLRRRRHAIEEEEEEDMRITKTDAQA
jgi:hypothetical protein